MTEGRAAIHKNNTSGIVVFLKDKRMCSVCVRRRERRAAREESKLVCRTTDYVYETASC